ncbi:uncharacterized protein MELLADRAFT_88423 [Melampsora larici-populina 98AG31]|uniref:CxC5 like cysteine cluster associated with KDZ domain-containing protein n=1 Tax=Melampsora larici-populina (strain 98AG31 / pathotype 3-4-7) TaxID=747676 RepID=F4RRN7_MELLP|nr:uncharacterized protein MELLADRAFT_88423 [Melampsora larici-populina 98AG31]EGG04959.1 hypothetical protein MELLADRAFT_88423 [Melampsora larici-populina 98AG31]
MCRRRRGRAVLPSSIHNRLEVLWEASFCILKECFINAQYHVKSHGIMPELDDGRLPIRIVEQSLYPPFEHCPKCSRTRPMRAKSLFGYLYDVDGCHTIEHFYLYCQPCRTSYHVSYSIYNEERTFYTTSEGRNPEVFQVHTHYFMTHRLAHHFKMSQMLQRIVNLYNSTFMGSHTPPLFTSQQAFFPRMSAEVCKDGMGIDTLLFNYSSRSKVLVVPDSGLDRVRYNEAKKECTSWIAAEGTAHKNHACSLCTCITYSEEYNKHSVVCAVVTDGLTIGHWRCSASASQLEMLAKDFGHPAPDGPCRRTLDTAQPCTQPALANKRTCGLQSHQEAAKTFSTRVNSNFQLHSMLNRPGSNLNLDPSVHLEDESGEIQDLESLQQADESDRVEESQRSGEEGSTKKPTLSRARTHNDQLVVAPCGVILARQTMFNSESPSAVKIPSQPACLKSFYTIMRASY